jgi:hypothetical protein
MKELGGEYADMELVSIMSMSKGFMGEYVYVTWNILKSPKRFS